MNLEDLGLIKDVPNPARERVLITKLRLEELSPLSLDAQLTALRWNYRNDYKEVEPEWEKDKDGEYVAVYGYGWIKSDEESDTNQV